VLVCLFLILVVLLQAGRGGGMGSAFGGSSQSVFGGAGAGNFLTRLTVIRAALFMVLSATLAFLSSSSDKALERAARTIKTREEARNLTPKEKKRQAAEKGAQSASSPAPATAPGTGTPASPAAPEGAGSQGSQSDQSGAGTSPEAPSGSEHEPAQDEPAPAGP
jgi:preprotein translocase subunit SecG